MAKKLQEIKFVKRDNHSVQFTLKNEANEAIDVSAYAITLTVRTTASAAAASIELKTADGEFTMTDAATGVIIANFLPADTASVDAGAYVYDLQLVSGAVPSITTTPVIGNLVLEQDITQA